MGIFRKQQFMRKQPCIKIGRDKLNKKLLPLSGMQPFLDTTILTKNWTGCRKYTSLEIIVADDLRADLTVLNISMVIVIGPTPPGTGVI